MITTRVEDIAIQQQLAGKCDCGMVEGSFDANHSRDCNRFKKTGLWYWLKFWYLKIWQKR